MAHEFIDSFSHQPVNECKAAEWRRGPGVCHQSVRTQKHALHFGTQKSETPSHSHCVGQHLVHLAVCQPG